MLNRTFSLHLQNKQNMYIHINNVNAIMSNVFEKGLLHKYINDISKKADEIQQN